MSITAPVQRRTASGTGHDRRDGVTTTSAVAHVTFAVNGVQVGDDTDGSDGWSAELGHDRLGSGRYGIRATAFDSIGQQAVRAGRRNGWNSGDGSWVGLRGVDGYALLGWTGSGDLVALPNASLSVTIRVRSKCGERPRIRVPCRIPAGGSRQRQPWLGQQISATLTFPAGTAVSSTSMRSTGTARPARGPHRLGLIGERDIWMTSGYPRRGVDPRLRERATGRGVDHCRRPLGGQDAVLSGIFLGGAGVPPSPPPSRPAATTTRSRAGPRRTPPHRRSRASCIPTDAQVAAVGRPFAIWATIDVTTASDSEVRFGINCTGVSGITGYGTPVTLSAPPTTSIGWQRLAGAHPGGHPVTVDGYSCATSARPGCPAARVAACSAAGRRPRPGPPACS